jgi:hypothetical protein
MVGVMAWLEISSRVVDPGKWVNREKSSGTSSPVSPDRKMTCVVAEGAVPTARLFSSA